MHTYFWTVLCLLLVISTVTDNPFILWNLKQLCPRHPMAYGTEQRMIKEEYVKDCFVFENHIFKKWNTDAMYCLIKASQEFIPKRDVIQTSDQSNDEIAKNEFSFVIAMACMVFVINWHWCYSRLFDAE